jgi:hypothetical protein
MNGADGIGELASLGEAKPDPRGVVKVGVGRDAEARGADLKSKPGAFAIRERNHNGLRPCHTDRRERRVVLCVGLLDGKRDVADPRFEFGSPDFYLVERDRLGVLEHVPEDRGSGAVYRSRYAWKARGRAELGAVHEGDSHPVGRHSHNPLLVPVRSQMGPLTVALADDLVAEDADNIETRVTLRDRERPIQLGVRI